MPGVAQTLTEDAGPLPVWAWAGLGVVGIGGYLLWRKKQQMNAQTSAGTASADSSNLGSVPISNLTTQAEPMPIQQGDTFVNVAPVSQASTQTQTPPAPAPSTSTTPAAAANQYPVGSTQTTASSPFGLQTIIQALNLGSGKFVDLTSEGGLLGSGVNVSGSAFKKGTSGYTIKAGPNGTVQEYQNGKLVGTYTVK